MPTVRLATLAFAGSALVAGCASKSQTVYTAPTSKNLFVTVENPAGGPRQRVTYIQNKSTEPIIVTGVIMTMCTNVRERCDSKIPKDVRVLPGQRAEILQVHPQDRAESFSYRMMYWWRPEKGAEATLASMAGQEPADARLDPRAAERAETARRAAAAIVDPVLDLDKINALGARVAFARVEPDSLVMQVGDTVSITRIRIRMILFDSTGQRLGRVERPRWRRALGDAVVFTPPYLLRAAAPGSAVIEFVLPEEALPERPLRLGGAVFTIVVRP